MGMIIFRFYIASMHHEIHINTQASTLKGVPKYLSMSTSTAIRTVTLNSWNMSKVWVPEIQYMH